MTIRFIADENIDPDLVLGLPRRVEEFDIVRVQDVGLRTADDPTILQWAADEGRVLVTHDIRTVPDFAHERVVAGLLMPGVFVVPTYMPIREAIDELTLIAAASVPHEWDNRVVYLPLR